MKRKQLASIREMIVASVLLAATVSFSASAADLMHARVSFSDGNGLIKGLQDDEWSYAPLNTVVLASDSVWTDESGMMEIEFDGGSFLRLADASKAEVSSFTPDIHVMGWSGSIYVHRLSRARGTYTLETPACKIDFDTNTQARIDILQNGSTTVSVRWGRAHVETASGGRISVGEGRRTYIDPGLYPSTPMPFDRSLEDPFDSWNRERVQYLVSYEKPAARYIRAEDDQYPVGYADLDRYGEWLYVDNSYAWRPTAVVDFTPYRYGSWSYVNGVGYSWVSSQPFGYVTSHYGRWRHHRSHGWIWTHSPTWGPAWVATVRYGDNFLWTPLDPFDRPVSYGSSYYTVGGLRFSVSATSYCPSNNIILGANYVRPCTTTLVRDIYGHHDVSLWNIYGNGYRPRIPYNNHSTLRVFDYKPQRSIRGYQQHASLQYQARDRVSALEHVIDRNTFRTSDERTGYRRLRTSLSETSRQASVRQVRLADPTPSFTRASAPTRSGVRSEPQSTPASTIVLDRTGRSSSSANIRADRTIESKVPSGSISAGRESGREGRSAVRTTESGRTITRRDLETSPPATSTESAPRVSRSPAPSTTATTGRTSVPSPSTTGTTPVPGVKPPSARSSATYSAPRSSSTTTGRRSTTYSAPDTSSTTTGRRSATTIVPSSPPTAYRSSAPAPTTTRSTTRSIVPPSPARSYTPSVAQRPLPTRSAAPISPPRSVAPSVAPRVEPRAQPTRSAAPPAPARSSYSDTSSRTTRSAAPQASPTSRGGGSTTSSISGRTGRR